MPVLSSEIANLHQVFDCSRLPRRGPDYFSYQLVRNVLAAYALNLQFCVLLDARRPDLFEQWYRIIRCVSSADMLACEPRRRSKKRDSERNRYVAKHEDSVSLKLSVSSLD